MAARGRISDDKSKIIVTGFSQSATEETYRAKVTGISNAEKNNGQLVESNTAVIKREASAKIEVGGSGASCSGYSYSIAIRTTNIKPGSLTVSSYPDFISSFKVTDTQFCYNLYPNYGGVDSPGCVVIAGTDIYGNSILSNCFTIQPGGNVPKDEIKLTCPEGYDRMVIEYKITDFLLNYTLVGNIVSSTLAIYDTEGNIIETSVDKTSPNGNVHVKIPMNGSRNMSQTYKICISGLNDYGVTIISNWVTVEQTAMEGNSQFYLTGENIPYDATTATFIIHQSGITDIGLVWHSDNITNPAVSIADVVVETEVNNSSKQKVLEVRVSGKTSDGKTVFADGALYQEPGVFLRVATGDTDNVGVSSYTNPNSIEYYAQSHTFRYIAVGVTGITASGNTDFNQAGGRISINPTTKIVTLSFSKNNAGSPRKFVITLTGNGGSLSAEYKVDQRKYGDGEFNLTAKDGFETSSITGGTINSGTTVFTLNINYPEDGGYGYFGVSRNDSTSNKYKIVNPEISDDHKTLTCHTDVNTGSTSIFYTIQVSAVTADNKVKYTNTFTIEHNTNEVSSLLKFDPVREKFVEETETGVTKIKFTYSGISYAYVEYCSATTGSDARVTRFDFDGKELDVSFSSYPPQKRTIEIRLGGIDSKGNPYTGNTSLRTYTITQRSNGAPSIEITPANTYRLPDNEAGHSFSYQVKYKNCVPMTPIYNSAVFSGPSTSTAQTTTVLIENVSNDDVVYTIKYRGRSNINGETVYAALTVTQPKKAIDSSIFISSNSSYLNEDKQYVINVSGGTYQLKIETVNIDLDSLVAIIDPTGNATAYTESQMITFGPASGEGGTTPTPKVPLVGGLTGNTLSIPAGNLATYYFPKLLQITKEDATHLEGGKYVYNIELDPDTGSSFSDITYVSVSGVAYDGREVMSKSRIDPEKEYIVFVQSGTTEPESGSTGSTPSTGDTGGTPSGGDDEYYIGRDWSIGPEEVPWSGGVTYLTFLYRGVVDGTLGYVPLSSEIENIEVEYLGRPYNRGYQGRIKITLGETSKSVADGYYASENRWVKVTGTSENDMSELSYVGIVTQEPYVYLNFPYNTANVDTEMFQRNVSGGLLTIPLEANHIDATQFSYKYCTDSSTVKNPTYINGSEIVETVLQPRDVGNASYSDKTYSEAIPIELKTNGVTIDGTFYQYYLEVGMQRYKRYDSRNSYGHFPVMLTFKGFAGGSWNVMMNLEQSQEELADVTKISFDTSHSWWPPTDSPTP